MKKLFVNALLITAVALGTIACKGDKKNETAAEDAKEVATLTTEAVKFKVDTDASVINWLGSKPTGTHNGTIKLESGVVRVAGDKITGTFLIDMNSINVTDLKSGDGKESLESHLKGLEDKNADDFFNVNKYPTAAFEVTGVTEKEGKKMMQGNLTMKGVKKNIEFPVTYSVNGDKMTLSSETFTIDRTEWGIEFMSKSAFDDLKDKFISDDMELSISLQATKA